MHSDREINKAVGKRREAPLRVGQHRPGAYSPALAIPGDGHSLNKFPFHPTWPPAMPVPVGRIGVQVRLILDRIQVSIAVTDGILGVLRDALVRRGFTPRGKFTRARAKSGKLDRTYRFEMDGSQIYLIRPEAAQHAPWYRLVVCQPTRMVQEALVEVLGILPWVEEERAKRQAPWYVSQVEIALDVRPVENQHLGLVRLHIEHGLTHPNVRSRQSGKCCETCYLGRNGNVRDGAYGIRTYVKSEAGQAAFVRCEVQLNRERLRQLGLRRERGLLISPGDVDWVDHLQYRFLDTKRLESCLASKFRGQSGRFRWARANILHGGTVASALDAMRGLNRKYPGLKLERIFLRSPKQIQLFEDMSQGFVRPRYRTRPFPKITS